MIVPGGGLARRGRGIDGIPDGFQMGMDRGFPVGTDRRLEPDHEAAPLGARFEHAVIEDEIDPRA